jgi:hypothetical protein
VLKKTPKFKKVLDNNMIYDIISDKFNDMSDEGCERRKA